MKRKVHSAPKPPDSFIRALDNKGNLMKYAKNEIDRLLQIEQAAKALYKDRAYAWQKNHMWDDLGAALYGEDDPG